MKPFFHRTFPRCIAALLCLLTACTSDTGHDSSHLGDSLAAGIGQPADSGIVKGDSLPGDSATRYHIEGAFTVPAAMEVIYGLYDRDIECSKWVCMPHEAKRFESKASSGGTLHTRPAGVFPIPAKEGRKMLLLTETLSREKEGWEDCHACAPILGAAMFQEIDGAWFIEALEKDMGELGSYGTLPPSSLMTLGPDFHGVRFDYGYTAQGITSGGILIIGMVDGKFEELLSVDTDYDNLGLLGEDDPRAYKMESRLTLEDNRPGQPFDLLVHRFGRRPKDGIDGSGPIVEVSEELRYRLKGSRYELQK